MPRPAGKAKKIAYALLGAPSAQKKKKKSRKQREINAELTYQETSRVR